MASIGARIRTSWTSRSRQERLVYQLLLPVFGLLLVIGISTLIFTHVFQNVGMTISILPITGVPLPLISYSGSFALMIMFGLGIVNSVWVHRKVPVR